MMDDQPYDDWEGGEFSTLYEEWTLDRPFDPTKTQRLLEIYRDSWRAGNTLDQYCITFFIWRADVTEAVDLLVEGMYSEDRRVADQAAITASVCGIRDGFDVDRLDLRIAFHHLVRRWPLNELERYGFHLRPGEGPNDSDDRPFVCLAERWMATDPRDLAMTARLAETFRDAWSSGDAIDRAFVLLFLSANQLQKDPALITDGRDLVVEGLKTDDARLAPVAALIATGLIERGEDLGPGLREILESHRHRFPSVAGHIHLAISALDKREGIGSE